MNQVCIQDPPGESVTLLDQQAKTILIVDDEPLLLHLMHEILAEIGGYDVLTASTSREALLLATQQPSPPDLMVLDYMLFGSSLDGLELYDLLHAREGWQGVPCILASCNIPLDDVCQRGLLFLPKPFDMEQLLARVAVALATGIPADIC